MKAEEWWQDVCLGHSVMRSDLAALEACTAVSAPLDRDRAEKLAGYMNGFWRMVHHHHEAEDRDLFPKLSARDASFASEGTALASDHDVLEPSLRAVTASIATLVSAETDDRREASWRDLGQHVRALSALLLPHLEKEEAAVSARIGLLGEADIAQIERAMFKRYKWSEIGWSVSWILAGTRGEEHEIALKRIPWLLRVIHQRFWQPDFDEVAAPLQAFRR